jgi:hypothetical protein
MAAKTNADPMTAAAAPKAARKEGRTMPRTRSSSQSAGATAIATSDQNQSSAFAGLRAACRARKPSR